MGVINAVKFESALTQVLGNEHRVLLEGECMEKLVLSVGCHVQSVFAMCRYMKQEQESKGESGSRRFPRTGGFRKTMSAEDWVLMQGFFGEAGRSRAQQACPSCSRNGASWR